MRLETSQHQRLEMRQRMAPRMIQSMEILQLPLMALQERIDQEMSENPVLELREVSPTEPDADAEETPAPEEPSPSEPDAELEPFDTPDEWPDTYTETHRMSRAAL